MKMKIVFALLPLALCSFAEPLDEDVWPAVVPEFTPGPSARIRRDTHMPADQLPAINSQLATNLFAKPVKARYFRFVATHALPVNDRLAVAEVDVL